MKKLIEEKEFLSTLLNERELLLETLIEELKLLKKKYNIKRKTKILKDVNQENEINTINNQILDELINKKTKISIDNRLYLKKIISNNYKKILENENKIIDNKNVQKFICTINKNLKIIGITYTGKVFQIDWKENINNDYKLDNKVLGNIDNREILNFHYFNSNIKNYLCILNSDGRFKKVLFDKDMIKSNRIFSITKLKNDIKIIDSFIYKEEKNLIILTSIGRIFKYDLSNQYLAPTTKQSQGSVLVKLLPKEKIVSCCKCNPEENLYLVSLKGKFFKLNNDKIYDAKNSKLGYINEKIELKNDQFIKVFTSNEYLNIETNKNRSARINLNTSIFDSKKNIFEVDFLKLDKDEYFESCFKLEHFYN